MPGSSDLDGNDMVTDDHDEARQPHQKNAFTELMSRKPKPQKHEPKTPVTDVRSIGNFAGRDGLAAYTANPASFPPDRVISYDEQWVVINDLYPKSSVHLLLLTRDASKMCLHPFVALSDPIFLAGVRAEVAKLRALVASELRRKYGRFSAVEQTRNEALGAEPPVPPENLPSGRDWSKEVMAGVHAHPSMNHLHIHILSVDRVSPCMRHRKHYNSFNTPFLVPIDDFPLAEDDKRRHPGREGYLEADMTCWRCGKNFRRKFAALKSHLEEEIVEWSRT